MHADEAPPTGDKSDLHKTSSCVVVAQVIIGAQGRQLIGLIGAPLGLRISKCRFGPVASPERPTQPMISPAPTVPRARSLEPVRLPSAS